MRGSFCIRRVRVAARIRLFCLEKGCLYSPQQAGAAAEPAAPVVGYILGLVEELAVIAYTGLHLVNLLCVGGVLFGMVVL